MYKEFNINKPFLHTFTCEYIKLSLRYKNDLDKEEINY